MSKRWPHPSHRPPPKKQIPYLLDQFSSADIKKWKSIQDLLLKYHWDFYSSLAFQRSKISDEIRKSLLEASHKSFVFSRWQRVVRFKYSVEPLSLTGSLMDPGGRFNIGDINPAHFPPFPALYIASDKETATQEILCQKIDPKNLNSALSFALADPTSITNASVSGRLDTIIDLKQPSKLQSFIDIFKNFTIPDHLYEIAKILEFKEKPEVIRTVPKLIDALLAPNWREWPMQFDVPVASQIFGQLVMSAGIEGILYTSKFSNKDCLVIFPQNFDDANGSLIQLDDPAPKETKILKWDAAAWRAHGSTYQ